MRSALVALALLGVGPAPHAAIAPASAAPTADERALYRAALADLYASRLQSFERKVERLGDYPLVPYLHYARMMRYISRTTPEEMAEFRRRYADTPLADRALREWLENLAGREQWQTYVDVYEADVAPGTVDRCHFHIAQLRTGDRSAAFSGARQLWLVARSQPDACDPLFETWIRSGGLDEFAVWRRLDMSMRAGNVSLARYLLRFLDGEERTLAEQYVRLHRAPNRVADLEQIPGGDGGEWEQRVVAHALVRLARQNARDASTAWLRWSRRLDFDDAERRLVMQNLIRHGARQDVLPEDFIAEWPPTDLGIGDDTDLVEELARIALREKRWADLEFWIAELGDHARNSPEWRYWSARSTLERFAGGGRVPAETPLVLRSSDAPSDPRSARAAALATLADLSTQRGYYGFLAAHRTGRRIDLNAAERPVSEDAIASVARTGAVQRALELRALGEVPEGRREMFWALPRMEREEQMALAEFMRRAQWPRIAIAAVARAESWDMLAARFPLSWRSEMVAAATAQRLEPSWVYAVARQESAFMPDARSGAGALGLMQVLPSTARSVARRENIDISSTWALIDPSLNIRLGSAYLERMHERFDGNRAIASAAYNAGPTRVSRWLDDRPAQPLDWWIDTIPYRETRRYVRNVLTYSLIYSHRLGSPHPFLIGPEDTMGMLGIDTEVAAVGCSPAFQALLCAPGVLGSTS